MLRSIVPKTILSSNRASKRIATQFSEEAGLVYFGYVSQRDDEHHIVRGLTVSTKHRDDHYCIGTYDGYDVVFVERSDKLHSGKDHMWHIIEIDLRSAIDIPHVFISSTTRTPGFHELIEAKYHTMLPHVMGTTRSYPTSFKSHFNLYTTPAHAVDVERLISPQESEVLAKHCKGLIFELTHDALYVYSEKAQLSTSLLMTMLTNGVWLARQIDQNSRQA
jgi:hypothetical protein